MFARFSKLLALIAAVHLLGGHLAVLQSAAWVGMFYKFVHSESVNMAVVKTFNGEHPCSLCKAVWAADSKERQEQKSSSLVKIEAVVPYRTAGVVLNISEAFYSVRSEICVARIRAVPTPPPRLV